SPVRARGTEAARATIEVRSSGPVPGITRGRAGAADRARVRWLPVLEVSGSWLHPWARLVSGCTTDWTPLQAAPLTVAARPRPAEPSAEPTTPATWIAHFEEGYSPEAFRLLCLLAAAPLSLPVMRLVQRSMLPESTPMHLAEVFLSGLLVRRTPARTGEDPDSVLYDFRDGVRQSLLPRLTRTESLRVLRGVIKGVSERVEATFGGVTDFPALVAAAGADGGLDGLELPEGSRAFAEVALAVIRGTGGDYAEVAARLVEGVGGPAGEMVLDQAELVTDEAESERVGRGAWWRRFQPRLERFRYTEGQEIPNESPLPAEDDGAVGERVPSRIPELPDHHERRGLTYSVLEVLRRGSPGVVARYPVSGPTVCVVEGAPGVGKTSLAIDCARELEAEFSLVRWLRADSFTTLREELAALATELGVMRRPNDFFGLRAYMRDHPGWLLIYDGVTSDTVAPWVPEGYGSLLMTVSEGAELPAVPHETVTLDDFSGESALRYVEKALPRGESWTDRGDLLDLLEVTGTHPLALSEAVSRIEADHESVMTYVMTELVRRSEVARFLSLLVWITRDDTFLGLGVVVKPNVVVSTAIEGVAGEFRVHQLGGPHVYVAQAEPSSASGLTLLTLSEAVLSPATLSDPGSAPAVAVWLSRPDPSSGKPAVRLRPISPETQPPPPSAALIDADGRLCALVNDYVDRVEVIAVTPRRVARSARVKRPSPLFYLSYASGPSASGKSDSRFVTQFVNDLASELLNLTGLRSDSVSYFPLHEELSLGEPWLESMKYALARAQVFVPLYSPGYFRSAWCGMEWGAFNRRQQQQSGGGARSAIVPVLWNHVDPEQLPPVARNLQYTRGDLGERYAAEGLYGLLASESRSAYRHAVLQLASVIANVALRTRLNPCDPALFDDMPNAFETDEP
ncbi:TIR-like protein FxsC, partial [Streptomyces sp. W16]|uniref:TIR-like protein FxsC n=1 Tax=Streptomyces sp. W16 TaxID=3076631 RepID=UPI00295B98FB